MHRIGRTARLGAEGDAISFACDMYAQSLPDIETYIGQKIPTAAIDPALLVLPPPRHRPDLPAGNVEDEDDGSVPVKGPPPSRARGSRSRSGGSSSGPRRDGQRRESARHEPRRETPTATNDVIAQPAVAVSADGTAPKKRRRRGGRGRRHGERKPRGDRPHEPRPPRAPRAEPANVEAVAPVAVASDASVSATDEGERKRRRRRGGRNRRREGGEAVATNAVQGKPQATPAEGGRPPRGERRAPRERVPAEAVASAAGRPSRQVAATAGEHTHPNKPSLFRRLTRLFTGR